MQTTVRVSRGGRFVIPAEIRKAFQIHDGTDLVVEIDKTGFRVIPFEQAIENIQKKVARFIKSTDSLADELLAERKMAAAREYGDD